jgi:hypothetical protein
MEAVFFVSTAWILSHTARRAVVSGPVDYATGTRKFILELPLLFSIVEVNFLLCLSIISTKLLLFPITSTAQLETNAMRRKSWVQ